WSRFFDRLDPFPASPVVVAVQAPPTASIGTPASVSCRLLDGQGRPLSGAVLRFTLRAGEGAVFSSGALAGKVVSGGGTGEVVVESEDGAVQVQVVRSSPGRVLLEVVDSAGVGLS